MNYYFKYILVSLISLTLSIASAEVAIIKNPAILDGVKKDNPDEYPEIIKLITLSDAYRTEIEERVQPVSLYSGESIALMSRIGEVCKCDVDKMRLQFPRICKNSGFIGVIHGNSSYKEDRILIMYRNDHNLIFVIGANDVSWNFQVNNDVRTSCHDPCSVSVRHLKNDHADQDYIVAVYYPRRLSSEQNARKVVALIELDAPQTGDDQQANVKLVEEKTIKLPPGNYPKDDPDFDKDYWPFDPTVNHYAGWKSSTLGK